MKHSSTSFAESRSFEYEHAADDFAAEDFDNSFMAGSERHGTGAALAMEPSDDEYADAFESTLRQKPYVSVFDRAEESERKRQNLKRKREVVGYCSLTIYLSIYLSHRTFTSWPHFRCYLVHNLQRVVYFRFITLGTRTKAKANRDRYRYQTTQEEETHDHIRQRR